MKSKLKSRRVITPDQIALITGMDKEAADREYDYVRSVYGVTPDQLTIQLYCLHHGYNYREVKSFLFPRQQPYLLWFIGKSEGQQLEEDLGLIL